MLRRPELEPERNLAMDSALSDPHNGTAEAGTPANGTTRPPSTPEGIALAYGSLLLMALLPIFFGALRSVRCARGKVGSGRKRAPSTPILATDPGTGPRRPDSCPLSRDTHPPGLDHHSLHLGSHLWLAFGVPGSGHSQKRGLASSSDSGPQTDPAISPPPRPLLHATAGNPVGPTPDTKTGADSELAGLSPTWML